MFVQLGALFNFSLMSSDECHAGMVNFRATLLCTFKIDPRQHSPAPHHHLTPIEGEVVWAGSSRVRVRTFRTFRTTRCKVRT